MNLQTIFGSWLLAWFAMARPGAAQVTPLPQKLDPYPVVANVSF